MSEEPPPSRARVSRIVEVISTAGMLGLAVAGFLAVPQLVSGWRFVMPGTTDAALSPTFFPRLAFVLIGVTATLVMLTAFLRQDELPIAKMCTEDWLRFGGSLGLVVLYVTATGWVGFLPASIVFVAAMALLSGYRNYMVIALTSVLAPLSVLIAFRYGLRVLLPSGTIF